MAEGKEDKGKWYELRGAKGAVSGATSIVLEGTYDDPKRVMVMGEPAQLTEEEHTEYRRDGVQAHPKWSHPHRPRQKLRQNPRSRRR